MTLDDDVAVKLRAEARRRGLPFRQVVNDYLRTGLHARIQLKSSRPFVVRPRALGVRPGLNYDNTFELIDQLEGPAHR